MRTPPRDTSSCSFRLEDSCHRLNAPPIRGFANQSRRSNCSVTSPPPTKKNSSPSTPRKASHRLGILVLLKVFLRLRRFPPPEEIPPSVVQFARIHLGFSENILMPYHER